MRILKTVLCIILAGVIILSFAGCSPKDFVPEKKDENTADYKKVVEEFIDSFQKYNIANAKTYLTNEKYAEGVFEFESDEQIKNNYVKKLQSGASGKVWTSEDALKYTENLMEMFKIIREYKPTDYKEDKDTIIVTLECTAPDISKYNELLTNIALEVQDELKKADKFSDPAYREFVQRMINAPKKFTDKVTSTKTIVLVKKDDNYRIDPGQGDFKEIFTDSVIK